MIQERRDSMIEIRPDFLPLNRPSIGEAEISAVTECLKSRWITTGPHCADFEERFQTLTGARHGVSVVSATAGMHLVLMALGIGPGDEIITPSMTFASTINMITLLGATPVFVDIEYDTLNIDCDQIEARITSKTRAIIPVHFAGAPADMERIGEIADRHRLMVIEDAAHAVGTRYRGTHAGGFGGIAVFSFHPLKNITTGEGGMITHNDEALERKLRILRFHGIERDAWKRYGKGGNPEYDIEEPGYKYNLTDIQAALGIAQLGRLDEFNRRRSDLVKRYREGLDGTKGLELPRDPPYPHTHSPSPIRGEDRCDGTTALYGKALGIQHRLRPSLPALPSFAVRSEPFRGPIAAGDGAGLWEDHLAAPLSGDDRCRCWLCVCCRT